MVKPTMSAAERNQFALKHEKLVRKIAHKYSLQCAEPWEDLFQIGYLGLLKAVERFDPTLGNAFSSFAVPYIQGEIQHYLRDEWGVVKVPRQTLETIANVKRIKRKLEALGANVDEVAVAGALQISSDKWEQLTLSASGSLAVPLNEAVCADYVANESIDAENQIRPARERLYEELYSLDPIARAIIQEAFFAGMSLTTIAKRHSINTTEASNILQQGLLELTQKLFRKE